VGDPDKETIQNKCGKSRVSQEYVGVVLAPGWGEGLVKGRQLSMVVHTCNPSTQEFEAG
jgi:hypothetical protein